ncbi:glycosyltransferase family 39 protein [Fischerella sp. PCC 9605]|uniref:glycosyltransferase family 39 protein n=1 Tax=Fischerella sp. PCC 9605 TaxID=1173024 RepID=UPI00047AF75B|nr:glycosyltransferase family 39 protein [Fischerella sp. PCC 9605]
MRRLVIAPRGLQFLIVVVLVIGIFFRFVNIDGKVYSHDEIYTSLRISGCTTTQVKQQIFNGRVISKQAFAKFQGLNSEQGCGDTIRSLAIEDPRHPPFYYLIARFWMQVFGSSVTAIRSLSALISLLVFLCAYWLCKELFNVPLSLPGIAIALMAISPIQLIYAQEAQEYILWEVTILLSSAALLRALRLESIRQPEELRVYNWIIYTVTLTLSLYTFLLSGFVAIAHGIYVLATAKFRWNKTVKAYLLASLAGFLAFMPWMLIAIANQFQFKSSSSSTTNSSPSGNLITFLLMQLSRIFFDLNLSWENPLSLFMTLIIFILVIYAIYFIWRTTHQKVWLFIITLILVPALPLIIPDLIVGEMRSFAQLDLVSVYLGIQIAVAYLLATQLYNGRLSRRQIWQMILSLVIIAGIISCAVYSQAETWWSKLFSQGNPQISSIINQADRPLLISNDLGNNYANVFSISYLVEPKVRFLLVQGKNIPQIPKDFTDIFLLTPSDTLRKGIAKKYKLKTKIVYKDEHTSLWKIFK